MDYLEVIKKSFKIVWQNKFLWIFGFFIGGTVAGFNFGGGNIQNSIQEYDKEIAEKAFWRVRDFFLTHQNEIIIFAIIAGLVLFLFALLMIILRIYSKGALIKAVNEIDNDKITTFKESFRNARPYFWKILGLGIIFFILRLIIIGIPAIVIVGIIVLGFTGKETLLFVVIGGIIAFILFVFIAAVIGIFLNLLQIYATCFLILKDQKVTESIKKAFSFFKNFWKQTLLMWLWLLLIGIAVGIAVIFGIIILAIPFILLGIILGLILNIVGIIITAVLSVITLIVVMTIVRGAVTAYFETAWVLTFKRLFEKQNTSLKEEMPEPQKIAGG